MYPKHRIKIISTNLINILLKETNMNESHGTTVSIKSVQFI